LTYKHRLKGSVSQQAAKVAIFDSPSYNSFIINVIGGANLMFNNKVSVICTIICSLLLISIPGLTWDRAIEAEKADKIEAPMIVSDDAKASGGKFIWMEGKPATGGGGKGWAEFIINLPKAGTYALWGKVLAWDGNSDSLWVTWQPADPNEDGKPHRMYSSVGV